MGFLTRPAGLAHGCGVVHAIIVGAGPAGAALACLFTRRDIDVTLVERQSDFAREFRGEVVMPSGMEVFEQMGLRGEFDALPHVRFDAVEIYANHRPLLELDLTASDIGAATPRVVSQPAMLEMLVEQAGRGGKLRFQRGASAKDLVYDDGRVVGIKSASKQGESELIGDFVIGADGRSSMLRKRSGLHEERHPQMFDVVWCKIPRPDFLAGKSVVRFYLGRGHLAIALPSHDGRLQLGWVIAKGTFGELRQRGIGEWLDEMAAHVSEDLSQHLIEARDEATQPFLLDVICDCLVRWTAPGLLLLGDAAHPMSPVGAQGINIALRDAIVAANHLCPALTGGVTPASLDAAAARVSEERLGEVVAVQRMQQMPPRLLFGESVWSRLVLRLLPTLVRVGVAGRLYRKGVGRIVNGVTDVRLKV